MKIELLNTKDEVLLLVEAASLQDADIYGRREVAGFVKAEELLTDRMVKAWIRKGLSEVEAIVAATGDARPRVYVQIPHQFTEFATADLREQARAKMKFACVANLAARHETASDADIESVIDGVLSEEDSVAKFNAAKGLKGPSVGELVELRENGKTRLRRIVAIHGE